MAKGTDRGEGASALAREAEISLKKVKFSLHTKTAKISLEKGETPPSRAKLKRGERATPSVTWTRIHVRGGKYPLGVNIPTVLSIVHKSLSARSKEELSISSYSPRNKPPVGGRLASGRERRGDLRTGMAQLLEEGGVTVDGDLQSGKTCRRIRVTQSNDGSNWGGNFCLCRMGRTHQWRILRTEQPSEGGRVLRR